MTYRLFAASALAVTVLTTAGCGPALVRIGGQLSRGGEPVTVRAGEMLSLSLVSEKGRKFDFTLEPDGRFRGPTEDDLRPLEPGPYTVLVFHWKPGARGPDVTTVPDGVTVEPGKTAGYVIDLPAKKK